SRIVGYVTQVIFQALVLAHPCKFDRLRRYFVTREFAVTRQLLLQAAQYFTRPATHFADASGTKPVRIEHADNLPHLPGGVLRMPSRILAQVLAGLVYGLTHKPPTHSYGRACGSPNSNGHSENFSAEPTSKSKLNSCGCARKAVVQ